jgi:hypothetical protein
VAKSKRPKSAKAGGKKAAKAGKDKGNECSKKEICKYLTALSDWLNTKLIPDYTDVRIALCNVEAKAFDNLGQTAKRFPKCGGGTGGDPTPPPPPPKWT